MKTYRYFDHREHIINGKKVKPILVFQCVVSTTEKADAMFQKETGANPNKLPYIGWTAVYCDPYSNV